MKYAILLCLIGIPAGLRYYHYYTAFSPNICKEIVSHVENHISEPPASCKRIGMESVPIDHSYRNYL